MTDVGIYMRTRLSLSKRLEKTLVLLGFGGASRRGDDADQTHPLPRDSLWFRFSTHQCRHPEVSSHFEVGWQPLYEISLSLYCVD